MCTDWLIKTHRFSDFNYDHRCKLADVSFRLHGHRDGGDEEGRAIAVIELFMEIVGFSQLEEKFQIDNYAFSNSVLLILLSFWAIYFFFFFKLSVSGKTKMKFQ